MVSQSNSNTIQEPKTEVVQSRENPLLNILFNIVLPVVGLNKLSKYGGESGPTIALFVGLAFPILYSAYELSQKRKVGPIPILGIFNVLSTGLLALWKLDGIWFAVKEALTPLAFGLAVIISGFRKNPFIKSVLWNPQILQTKKITEIIENQNSQTALENLFYRANLMFAGSFFLSAILNFGLALYVFQPIDVALAQNAQQELLNQQIAQMTYQGYLVISLPLMVITGFIFWDFFSRLKSIAGLDLEQILGAESSEPKQSASSKP
jgi:hypothetical protein